MTRHVVIERVLEFRRSESYEGLCEQPVDGFGRQTADEIADLVACHRASLLLKLSFAEPSERGWFTSDDSVTNEYGRTWDVPNLWICDGSLFPTGGGANPSLTIMALACRIGDRISAMAHRGDLN